MYKKEYTSPTHGSFNINIYSLYAIEYPPARILD